MEFGLKNMYRSQLYRLIKSKKVDSIDFIEL